MSIYFTSDNHFFHSNILRYCNRPFRDSHHMNEVMIKNWCEKVNPGDTVYILGDFAFAQPEEISRILDRLPGQKFLIYGNHDKTIKKNPSLREKFVKCVDYLEISVQDNSASRGRQDITLCHYAHLVWNKSHHGSWMLHGHSHGSLTYPYNVKILDVGVDSHNFSPISYSEVKRIMSTKGSVVVDHHGT